MDDRIFFHLSRAENKLKTHMKSIFREHGIAISPAQIGILFLLKKESPQHMSELSRILEIDNSAITRLVDNLEKMRYVKRDQNPDDRRQFLIHITPAGVTEIKRAQKIVMETNEKIKEGLTQKEVETFLKVVDAICRKFS